MLRSSALRNEKGQKTVQWIVFPTQGLEFCEDHFDG